MNLQSNWNRQNSNYVYLANYLEYLTDYLEYLADSSTSLAGYLKSQNDLATSQTCVGARMHLWDKGAIKNNIYV